jgi:hypothetical protein
MNEPEHRFLWSLMKMWSCGIDDPRIADMDPVLKIWYYYQWLGDQRDDAELAKNHAYLLGSFTNPEAVQELMGRNTHESTDEDLEESMKIVQDTDIRALQAPPPQSRRRRHRAVLKE